MFNALLIRFGVPLQRALLDQRGATAVESALIIGLVAIIILGAIGTLGGTLLGWFAGVDEGLATP